MVSAQQDSTRISYFFSRWLEDFKVPKEVTIDASAALKKSCSISFAQCNVIKDYLQRCYDVLLLDKTTELPKCFIRLDVAHFIKTIKRKASKILKKSNNAKHFYLCCIGVIIKSDDFDCITQIVEHMVKVANGAQGCLMSRAFPSKLIQIHDTALLNIESTEERTLEFKEEKEEDESEPTDQLTWFDEILLRVQESIPSR